MAVRFVLRFAPVGAGQRWRSTYVAAYGLRGALLPLLRESAGVGDLHGSRYALFAAPDPAPDGHLLAYLSVGDNGRSGPLAQGLAAIRNGAVEMRIGGVTVHLESFEVERQVGPESMLAAVGPGAIKVRFLTVTTFAAGNRRSRGVPDPALIVSSWASSWNGTGRGPSAALETGEPCPPDIIAELGRLLDPTRGTLTWGRAQLAEPATPRDRLRAPSSLYGFTGSLRLRLHRSADPVHALWLGRLAAIAPFVGTGYHVQLGLGVTEVLADRPEGPPAAPPEP